jgi:microcystin-dependent protein
MKRNYFPISRLLTTSVMLLLVSAITLLSQTPATINYQAVLRDTEGNPRSAANVSIELEIHQASETGIIVYSETHNTTTSEFGIINLEIGSVNPTSFETIDWSAGPYFVEVILDESSMGASELLAVPYALYAATANTAINDEVDDADADPSNELQQLSIVDDTIYLSQDGAVVLPVVGPPGAVTDDLMSFDGANWVARNALLQNAGGSQAQNNMQPWLGINHVIALQGIFPSRNGANPFLAEIYMFGGNFAPRGYAMCDGQLLAISQNTALFSLLGTTFGGDGRTTFGLPDLRGRVAIHPGTGSGLSTRRLGESGGSETNTMTIGQMPTHTHTISYQ